MIFLFYIRFFCIFASLLFPDSKRNSGCSAARLARVVRDDEVGSSNLPTPTTFKKPALCAGFFFSGTSKACFCKLKEKKKSDCRKAAAF